MPAKKESWADVDLSLYRTTTPKHIGEKRRSLSFGDGIVIRADGGIKVVFRFVHVEHPLFADTALPQKRRASTAQPCIQQDPRRKSRIGQLLYDLQSVLAEDAPSLPTERKQTEMR